MKTNIFITILLLSIFGCNQKQSNQLTQQEKDQIKKEVKAVGDSIIAKWTGLDGAGCFHYYSDSPDWVLFRADGLRQDYQVTKKAFLDFPNYTASIKSTTIHQDFIIITKDIVICAWEGKDVTILKSGDKITIDPHPYTLVFKKVAGEWKVIYSHDSGIPVIQKAQTPVK
jgi:hypothetical protein